SDLTVIHRTVDYVGDDLPGFALIFRTPQSTLFRIGRLICGLLLLLSAFRILSCGLTSSALWSGLALTPATAAASSTTTATTSGGTAVQFFALRTNPSAGARAYADFNSRHNNVRIRTRNVETDSTQNAFAIWQTIAFQSRPGLAGVEGLPDSAARTAAIVSPGFALALIRSGVKDFAVDRVHHDVGEASVLINELDVVPGLAAISRFVNAAIFVRSEQVAHRSYVNNIGIFRISDDASDRLDVLQTHVCEGLSAISRFVDSIANCRALSVIGFAAANPNDIRIRLKYSNVAYGRNWIFLKHRFPGRSIVCGFPDTAGSKTHIEGVGIIFNNRDIVDTPTHAGGTDWTKTKIL